MCPHLQLIPLQGETGANPPFPRIQINSNPTVAGWWRSMIRSKLSQIKQHQKIHKRLSGKSCYWAPFFRTFLLRADEQFLFSRGKIRKKINLHPTAKDKGGVSGTRNWIFSHHFCPERLETCSQNRPVGPSNNWIFIFLCDVFAFYISRKKSSRLPFLVFLHLPAVKEQRPINMASRDAS